MLVGDFDRPATDRVRGRRSTSTGRDERCVRRRRHRDSRAWGAGSISGRLEPTITVVVKLPSVANDKYPIAEGEAAPLQRESSAQ